jgi:cell division protein ZapA
MNEILEPQEKPEVAAGPAPSVSVDIYDAVYHLRGSDPAYIQALAATVDGKMRAVSAHGGTVDSLRVAVLAALNIADELATLRTRYDALAGSVRQSQSAIRNRAGSLAGMLDEVLREESTTRRAG